MKIELSLVKNFGNFSDEFSHIIFVKLGKNLWKWQPWHVARSLQIRIEQIFLWKLMERQKLPSILIE